MPSLYDKFKLVSDFELKGDQARAIPELVDGLNRGDLSQVLLGVTGSGKTFTMAKVIEAVNRPTLVMVHNKTLAAQLYQEFRRFSLTTPSNISSANYDYTSPSVSHRPTRISRRGRSSTTRSIAMRLSATRSLFERRDVIIVSTVVYLLPRITRGVLRLLAPAQLGQLIRGRFSGSSLNSVRANETDFSRGTFRGRGRHIGSYCPTKSRRSASNCSATTSTRSPRSNPLTGKSGRNTTRSPCIPRPIRGRESRRDRRWNPSMQSWLNAGRSWNRWGRCAGAAIASAHDVRPRDDRKDLRYCHVIENYSRISAAARRRAAAHAARHLPDDALLVSTKAIRRCRKSAALRRRPVAQDDAGRVRIPLPSALDNRPLTFAEWDARATQTIYVSATPGPYELAKAGGVVVEQIIRPTGLMDPPIEVRPVKGQIDDLLGEIRTRAAEGTRTLVTTLTKRMAEDLTTYYQELGVRVRYLHSEVETLERIQILRDLRLGEFDVLVGINLLREGLDLPEVSLVAILDADKEGFLRSAGS